MNLLHLRDDLQWSAARVARVTGAATIEALRLGDDTAALKAMNGCAMSGWSATLRSWRPTAGYLPRTGAQAGNDLESTAEPAPARKSSVVLRPRQARGRSGASPNCSWRKPDPHQGCRSCATATCWGSSASSCRSKCCIRIGAAIFSSRWRRSPPR
jgi:hypothetical protein